MFLVQISIEKEAGGWFFLLIIISYCMLSLHIIIVPQGYVGGEVVLKNKVGGDEKHCFFFFTWPYWGQEMEKINCWTIE